MTLQEGCTVQGLNIARYSFHFKNSSSELKFFASVGSAERHFRNAERARGEDNFSLPSPILVSLSPLVPDLADRSNLRVKDAGCTSFFEF